MLTSWAGPLLVIGGAPGCDQGLLQAGGGLSRRSRLHVSCGDWSYDIVSLNAETQQSARMQLKGLSITRNKVSVVGDLGRREGGGSASLDLGSGTAPSPV